MLDERTRVEVFLWERIGPPLYYCAECMRAVKVTPVDGKEPIVERKCSHQGQIMAPRKAVVTGKGGMSFQTKAKVAWNQVKASVTGRNA